MAIPKDNMQGRYECPECKGKGSVWAHDAYNEEWRVAKCWVCEGHKVVFVNDMGFITGPDAPPRYLCDHGKKLTDDCTTCGRTTQKELEGDGLEPMLRFFRD